MNMDVDSVSRLFKILIEKPPTFYTTLLPPATARKPLSFFHLSQILPFIITPPPTSRGLWTRPTLRWGGTAESPNGRSILSLLHLHARVAHCPILPSKPCVLY